MVKPLTFKGDKKPKKRKREADPGDDPASASSKPLPPAENPDDAPDNDDSWVSADAASDISGPILLVLPTTPPTCLACDAIGKVFAMEIENIIDGNPASAEPHDARQVWVANKVVGTEHFHFKGRYGKYLGCDNAGKLSASAQAVSPLESFKMVPSDSAGKFELKTLRDTFLVARDPPEAPEASETAATTRKPTNQPEVCCDAQESSAETTLRIRMQARFKPQLRQSKEEKARERISRRELEDAAGRRLDEDEVRRLKRAKREGDYHEQLLMIKVKNKHDKFG